MRCMSCSARNCIHGHGRRVKGRVMAAFYSQLADLLIWRANKSPRLLRRMSGVLEETSNPGHLVTLKGFVRLFTE